MRSARVRACTRAPATPIGLVLAVLGVVLCLPGLSAPARAAAAADPTDDADPLLVRITSLTPGYIRAKGPVRISGTVRNTDTETWQDVNVHALTSYSPITSRAELDDAARTDPVTTDIGRRRSDPRTFASIGDVAPGETVSFTITLPRKVMRITGAPGVYWLGMQALGTNTDGRDNLADGRARTFLPLVAKKASASASLVVPIRERVRRAADGSLLEAKRLAKEFADSGRLGRVAGVLEQDPALPVSLLVDPAVLDAAAAVARGNPPLAVGRASETKPDQGKDSTDSGDSSDSGSGAPTPPGLDDADRAAAKGWLSALSADARRSQVLGLPYADSDVSALARSNPALLRLSRALSRQSLADRKIDQRSAVAPVNGLLDPDLFDELGQDTTALVGDQGKQPASPFARLPGGQLVVAGDSRTAEGGALPEPRRAALAQRQRILADAALDALSGDASPLVVVLPATWEPGNSWQQARFLEGLQAPWLTWETLPGNASDDSPAYTAPDYDADALKAEVGRRNVGVAGALVHTSQVLTGLLGQQTQDQAGNGGADGDDETAQATRDRVSEVRRTLDGAALGAVSYHARGDRAAARVQVDSLDHAMKTDLAAVKVVGTEFVTLSGGSGKPQVAVVNGLDQPITIGLKVASTSPGVHVGVPKRITIAAGARHTVRLNVDTAAIGVHQVTLTPVTDDGREFGTPLAFSLRTSQVGNVVWALMAVGGVIVAVMIVRRIRQRLASHRWRSDG